MEFSQISSNVAGLTQSKHMAIECRALWKIYGANAPAALREIESSRIGRNEVRERFGCVVGVADASFSVAEGEVFCIMGLSGSGKSTLVRNINRLIDPTAGAIRVCGHDMCALEERDLLRVRSETIGMVFQHMALWPHRTILGNVVFGLEVRGVDKKKRNEAGEKALELVQLGGWGQSYPDELSGGMQQRVGLARALVSKPKVLLMDEPFSALDPLIRHELQNQFLGLSKNLNMTTLFITHDFDEAIRVGDRIAVMHSGEIVQIGRPKEIITAPADDYIAEFVKNVSPLKRIHAAGIMEPIETYRARHADDLADAAFVNEDDGYDELVDALNKSNGKVVVVSGTDQLGVISSSQLLNALRERDAFKN